jgi:hypothetical protein
MALLRDDRSGGEMDSQRSEDETLGNGGSPRRSSHNRNPKSRTRYQSPRLGPRAALDAWIDILADLVVAEVLHDEETGTAADADGPPKGKASPS